jgi:hypothetical protein
MYGTHSIDGWCMVVVVVHGGGDGSVAVVVHGGGDGSVAVWW